MKLKFYKLSIFFLFLILGAWGVLGVGSYPNCSSDPNAILCYHFNNDSGVGENYNGSGTLIYDYSGNNNGTAYNLTGYYNSTGSILNDGFYTFDNTSSRYIYVKNNASLNNISTITISMWIFPFNNSGSSKSLIDKSIAGTNRQFKLAMDGTQNYVYFSVNGSASSPTKILERFKWSYVVGTYNGTDINLYTDGVFIGSTPLTNGMVYNYSTNINIGKSVNYDLETYNGSIDDIIIYNRSLSLSEIFRNYQNYLGNYNSTMDCYYPYEDMGISTSLNLCSGTYYLNDTNTNGALIISSPNIKVNCNNTVLIGNFTATSRAFNINNKSNVSIIGCNIYNYEYGILTSSSNYLNISYNSFFNVTTRSISLGGTNYSNINFNNLTNNKFTIYFSDSSSYNNITNNIINYSRSLTVSPNAESFYFQTSNSNNNIIKANKFYDNEGVYIRGNNNEFSNNYILNYIGNTAWFRINNNGNNTYLFNNSFINNTYQAWISCTEGSTISCNNLTLVKNYFEYFSHATTLFNATNYNILNNTFYKCLTGFDGWNACLDIQIGGKDGTILYNNFSDIGNAGIIMANQNNVLIGYNYFDYLSISNKLTLTNIGGVLDETEPLCSIFNYQLYKSYSDTALYYSCPSCINYSYLNSLKSNNITLVNNTYGNNVQCYLRNQGGTNVTTNLSNYKYFSWQFPKLLSKDELWLNPNINNLSNVFRTNSGGINYTFYQGYNGNKEISYSWNDNYIYFKNLNITYYNNLSLFNLTSPLIYTSNTLTRNLSLVDASINFTLSPNQELYIYNSSTFNTTKSWTNALMTYNNGSVVGNRIVNGYYNIPWDSTNIINVIENFGDLTYTEDYNEQAYSGSTQTYSIDVIFDTTKFTGASAILHYNNTNYTGLIEDLGTHYIINRTLVVPNSLTQVNIPFYWTITLINSTQNYYFDTEINNQTLNPIYISLCNSTENATFLNFTIKDSDTNNLVNATLKANFQIGDSNYTYNNVYENRSNYPFCFNPSNDSYLTNAEIEYSNSNYTTNYYYLNNANLTNVSTDIDLYLLNDSKATLTVLRVIDDSSLPLPDVYITIQKYDISSGTYYTIGMAKSDYLGQDITYLNWYDTFYRFILTKNNTVLMITNSTKISATPKTFQVKTKILYPYDKFGKIIYTLSYDNSTKNFILTYVLPDGSVTDACLRVIKRTSKNDTTICNICEQSSSSTIFCNINAYGNGTYIAQFYAKGSFAIVDSLTQLIGISNQIYNLIGEADASIYAFLFAGIVCVMFLITPVLGIIGIILGVIGAMALGFTPINMIEFMGISIVGGIIIWLIKR
jgi:hypothetical protein